MPETCLFLNCTYSNYAKGYCQNHQYCRTDKNRPKPLQRSGFKGGSLGKEKKVFSGRFKSSSKNIQRYSKKRAHINRTVYIPGIKAMIEENPFCEVKILGVCTGLAEGGHHIEGKPTIQDLVNFEKIIPSCNACNVWIERNSKKAKELGLKRPNYTSKLSKFKT